MKSIKNIALSISLLVIVGYTFGVLSNTSADIVLDSSTHFSKSQYTPKFLHSKSLSILKFANIDSKDIEEEETEEEPSSIAFHSTVQLSTQNRKIKCIDNRVINVNHRRNLYLHFENFRL